MWNGLPERLKHSDKEYFTSIERILSSHHRCERLGLPRDIQYAQKVLGTDRLEEIRKHNNGLVTFTELLFATTFDRIPDKRMLLILTDAHARIIAIHSIPEIIRAATHKGVCLGASVTEDSLGTNAVSLALHDLEPAILHGEQHYCRILQDWCCIAIPLINAHGSPMGCLDISIGHETAMGEKVALASLLARELSSYGVRNSSPAFNPDSRSLTVSRDKTGVQLTERQHQVLALFSQGLSYKQIASRLRLQSAKTVQEHLDAIRAKLGATNRRECIRKAIEQSLMRD